MRFRAIRVAAILLLTAAAPGAEVAPRPRPPAPPLALPEFIALLPMPETLTPDTVPLSTLFATTLLVEFEVLLESVQLLLLELFWLATFCSAAEPSWALVPPALVCWLWLPATAEKLKPSPRQMAVAMSVLRMVRSPWKSPIRLRIVNPGKRRNRLPAAPDPTVTFRHAPGSRICSGVPCWNGPARPVLRLQQAELAREMPDGRGESRP